MSVRCSACLSYCSTLYYHNFCVTSTTTPIQHQFFYEPYCFPCLSQYFSKSSNIFTWILQHGDPAELPESTHRIFLSLFPEPGLFVNLR